jgi:hypothetical protein
MAAIQDDLTAPVANTFLAPGDEVITWAWRRTESNAALWREVDQARQRGRIRMRVCYCSLFDQCWIAETLVFPPTPVNACAGPAPMTPAISP